MVRTEPRVLVLASASPRRTELLAALRVRHEVRPARSPELPHGSAPAAEHARRSAAQKADEVARALPGRVVLGADTVVSLGERPDQVLGKPADSADAERMLRSLSGRTHEVVTGLALACASPHGVAQAVVSARTVVSFRDLGDDLIARYVATGEPLDKAGAYAVQGLLASQVVALEGSWSNVVGLPQERLPELFERLGLALEHFQDW